MVDLGHVHVAFVVPTDQHLKTGWQHVNKSNIEVLFIITEARVHTHIHTHTQQRSLSCQSSRAVCQVAHSSRLKDKSKLRIVSTEHANKAGWRPQKLQHNFTVAAVTHPEVARQ